MANQSEVVPTDQKHLLRDLSVALVAGLGLAMAALFLFTVPFAGHLAGSRDFVAYWATGQQLARHADPYDRESISALEHGAGLDPRAVLIMRNPPWALPLAYPFGFLSLRVGAILWSLLLAGCLVISVMLLRRLHGSPPNTVHWLLIAFTPALLCVTMGQTALLSLLGLVLFLWNHDKRPFSAGLALWLCLLKPHLLIPFAAALCVWLVYRRAWRIATGAVTALILSLAAAWLIAPQAWRNYAALMRSPAVENDFIPCLPVMLRQWLWPQAVWLQYLPVAICSIWALFYFWSRRSHWNWLNQGATLILVSLVAAPYCWLYDQCLAIPALLHGAYSARRQQLVTVLAALILISDIELGFAKITSPVWAWAAPVWLIWYFVARQSAKGTSSAPDLDPAISAVAGADSTGR